MYKILPQGTQILIEKIELKKEESTIILLDETKDEMESDKMPFLVGKILAKGQLTKYAKVGDIILYERHVPINFTLEGNKYSIFKEEYITSWLVEEEQAKA